jgi:hypothetical protein
MKFNVGITGKGYCFVEIPDLTFDEYMSNKGATQKVTKAIYEKYGNCTIQGFCPSEFALTVKERETKEKELIDILMKLKDTEEEATARAKSLSDSELISEITDAGMCVGWE